VLGLTIIEEISMEWFMKNFIILFALTFAVVMLFGSAEARFLVAPDASGFKATSINVLMEQR
jgi:hypothetical protein